MKLYTTGHPIRFFLVPADAPWPEGSDTVADVLGKPRSTELAALAARFELPRDEALAWSRGERARIEADVIAREASRHAATKQFAAELETRMSADGFDRERIAAMLGELGLDLDRLLADEEATARLFAEVVAVALLASDPAKRTTVLPAMSQVLRRHGYPDAAVKLQAGAKRIERDLDTFLDALKAASDVP